jgi:hypothetical protein
MTFRAAFLAAGLLALFAGLAGCSRPVPGERVDFSVDAQGRCALSHHAIACEQAGVLARAQVQGEDIHAVLDIDPMAPDAAKEALVTSLKKAHIGHMQFGMLADDRSQIGHLVF